MLVLTATGLVFAQETRRTVSRPPDAASEKPNSSAVPDAYAITGHFDRIVIVRCKYNTDLLAGIEQIVKQQHIRNGVILAGLGSVRGYHLHQVSSRDLPAADTYEKNPTQPADIVSVNGYVVDGKVHAHMTLATPDRVIAGHLEPGTPVLTFAVVTIGVMDHADLSRVDDDTNR